MTTPPSLPSVPELSLKIEDNEVSLSVSGERITESLCTYAFLPQNMFTAEEALFAAECFLHQLSLSSLRGEHTSHQLVHALQPGDVIRFRTSPPSMLYWMCFQLFAEKIHHPALLSVMLFFLANGKTTDFVPRIAPQLVAQCLSLGKEDMTTEDVRTIFQKLSLPPKRESHATLQVELLRDGLLAQYQPLLSSDPPFLSPQEMLKLHITACKAAHRKNYYGRCCPVVQSSGAGKTKLALECHKDFFLIYMCFRAEENAFPLRTPIADLFLQLHRGEGSATKGELLRFFCALFEHICDHSFLSFLASFSGSSSSSTSAAAVAHSSVENNRIAFFRAVNTNIMSSLAEPQRDTFWSAVEDKYRSFDVNRTFTSDDVVIVMKRALQHLEGLEENAKPQSSFLFVFDEVRNLFAQSPSGSNKSLFSCLRSVSEDVKTDYWFFLLLETTSNATNFYPYPKKKGISPESSSTRLEKLNLLPPFYSFPFTGPWKLSDEAVETCNVHQITAPATDFFTELRFNAAEDLLRYSRPMYMVHASGINISFDRTVNFAVEKFLGGDAQQALGPLLCYRYGLRPTTTELKEKLLSDQAATLEVFESTLASEKLVVGYLPEPMLGEAAARVLCGNDSQSQSTVSGSMGFSISFEQQVQHLLFAINQQQLGRAHSSGDRGEFAAAVYLLEMMRRAVKRAEYPIPVSEVEGAVEMSLASTPVPVHTLLQAMAGGANVMSVFNEIPLLSKKDRVRAYVWRHCLESFVNFTAIHEACAPLCPESLEGAVSGHVAWMAVRNEEGLDILCAATRRNDSEEAFELALELEQLADLYLKYQVIWEYDDEIANLKADQKKKGHRRIPALIAEKQEKREKIAKELEEAFAEFEREDLSDSRQKHKKLRADQDFDKGESFRPVLLSKTLAIALQIKNYKTVVYISEMLMYLRHNARYALRQTQCEMVISIVHMVGSGSFTHKSITDKDGRRPSLVLLDCADDHESRDVGDVDLRSLYVVINGFAGLSTQEQELVQQLASIEPGAATSAKTLFLNFITQSTSLNREPVSAYYDEIAKLQYKIPALSVQSPEGGKRQNCDPSFLWKSVEFSTKSHGSGKMYFLEPQPTTTKAKKK